MNSALFDSNLAFCFHFIALFIGVSSEVVPATYKKKKTQITAAPKVADGEDEKPAATEAAVAEGETPADSGRGTR